MDVFFYVGWICNNNIKSTTFKHIGKVKFPKEKRFGIDRLNSSSFLRAEILFCSLSVASISSHSSCSICFLILYFLLLCVASKNSLCRRFRLSAFFLASLITSKRPAFSTVTFSGWLSFLTCVCNFFSSLLSSACLAG